MKSTLLTFSFFVNTQKIYCRKNTKNETKTPNLRLSVKSNVKY